MSRRESEAQWRRRAAEQVTKAIDSVAVEIELLRGDVLRQSGRVEREKTEKTFWTCPSCGLPFAATSPARVEAVEYIAGRNAMTVAVLTHGAYTRVLHDVNECLKIPKQTRPTREGRLLGTACRAAECTCVLCRPDPDFGGSRVTEKG